MRRALLALIGLAAVWALAVALTGGFDLRPYGIPFKSTDPDRAAYALLSLVLTYVVAFRGHARTHAGWVEERAQALLAFVDRRGAVIAVLISGAVLALGMVYGIHVAGGSDSYGYISQADLWLARDLRIEQPIVRQVPWPDAHWTFAPLGYRPMEGDGATIVPTYSAGLSVLMAAGKLIGGMCGLFLVTPLLGALMVGSTYVLGAQLWSRVAGVTAAALMATSPAFLFMLMNPMSDVPVSGLFAAAVVISLWRSRMAAFWAGVVVSLAIFVRPNLVPLGAICVAWFVARGDGWGGRLRAAVLFGAGGLPLIAAIAATNAYLYGAPWKSGYGSLDAYYGWNYFLPNLRQYAWWLLDTETLFVALLLVPLVLLRRFEGERRARLLFVALFAAAVWGCYIFYTPYDAWWYLRFLLPAFPPMLVLAVIGCRMFFGWLRGGQRTLVLACIVVAVLALRIHRVHEQGILTLWRGGANFTSAAEYIRTELPPNAVILTVEHSGSVRYYADRLTMRWDWLAPEWWPRALDVLKERGLRPYFLIMKVEEAQLRRQFAFSDEEDAPGTVIATFPGTLGVVLYDPLREHTAPREQMPSVVSCPCAWR